MIRTPQLCLASPLGSTRQPIGGREGSRLGEPELSHHGETDQRFVLARRLSRRFAWLLVALLLVPPLAAQDGLQFADLGDFRLENGQTIHDCRIAYRTFGRLNAEKSNAILFPTWFSGTTEDLAQFMGPDQYLDTTKYFVVTVGALGNGFSSSPSNSKRQPGASFPRFTVRDMVRSQHQLLTEKLGIGRLHAVMGLSMGGMQTFEWIVAYPEFMDRAIPIIGSPQAAAYDLLLWQTQLNAIEQALEAHPDRKKARATAMKLVADIHQLALTTPARFNSEHKRDELQGFLAIQEAELIQRSDPYDWASQLRAMISHDVTLPFGHSMEQAAAAVKAKVLVIVALTDHMVNPQPALDFAKLLGAETLTMDGNCGHLAFGCESNKVAPAVREFLGK